MPRYRVALAGLALVLAACSTDGTAPTAGSGRDLTIFAAASLKDAIDAAASAYEVVSPGTTLTVSTDSSATLATQIELGAPTDLFLSADTANPARLAEAGFAVGSPVTFARNELTVIVPTGNPGGIATPADLARPGVKVVAAGDEVPVTRYAAELVGNLGREPGYPADYADAYAANVVSREDNVKAVVAKIELGEGDAAIVYATDAMASDAVITIDVPSAAGVVATYDGIVVKGSRDPGAARAFLDWLAGADGQRILADLGFLPPVP